MAREHQFEPWQPRSRRRFLTHGASLLGAAALGASGLAQAQPLKNIKLSVDYRLYGANAPLLYAQSSGMLRAAGINATVDGSAGSGDAINRVASGAYDAAYADIGTLAEFWTRNPSAAPKLVMVVLDRSPQAVVSLKKQNIRRLADLVGHKVGTGQADATSRLLPAVLKVNHVPLDKIKLVPVDQKLRDTMLVRGDVGAVVGFDSAILFNLMTQNIQPADTNVIYYADNGFDFYGNGLLVSRKLIEQDPDLVKKLTQVVARAWVASVQQPARTVAALAQHDSLTDTGLETRRLQWVINHNVLTPATRKGGLGTMDAAKFDHGLKMLAGGFGWSKTPTIADLYDSRFLPAASDRRLPA